MSCTGNKKKFPETLTRCASFCFVTKSLSNWDVPPQLHFSSCTYWTDPTLHCGVQQLKIFSNGSGSNNNNYYYTVLVIITGHLQTQQNATPALSASVFFSELPFLVPQQSPHVFFSVHCCAAYSHTSREWIKKKCITRILSKGSLQLWPRDQRKM